MKRSFFSPALEALCVVLGALACGAACEPDNGVKPGAPQLIEFTIVQAGPTATTITPKTPECPAIPAGAACMPAATPPDGVCRLADATTMNWCTCVVTDPMDPTVGSWSCDPFASVMAVVAVFDRLLDTTPLDPGDAPGRMDIVTTTAGSGAPAFDVLTDYSSTGASNGLIFNLFGPLFFGNFRADGPSLYTAPQPEFPSGTTITVMLNADKVLAKDGHTVFTGGGLLMGGSLAFTTAAFSVSVATPDADALMMDPASAATVAFTNFVASDAMTGEIIPAGSITAATSTGTAVPIVTKTSDGGASFAVTPVASAWPTGATVIITVDGAIRNLLDQALPAGATGMFTAP